MTPMLSRRLRRLWTVAQILLGGLLLAGLAWADSPGNNHRVRRTQYGVSGGSAKDINVFFCCGGTLGSLLIDSSNVHHILSNNHVLARSDRGSVGDDVTQPGLIDNNCRVATIVGDLDNWPRLGSNVDAATATLRCPSGTCLMGTDGSIMDIGIPSHTPASASIGLGVAKSGRTSGLTTGTIASVNTSVSVQYQRGCGFGSKFTVIYTNQIVTSSSMIQAGDSGSLLVVNDSCHQPVALLFAGSSSGQAIGNPVSEVLSKVGAALGTTVSFVGSTCSTVASATGGTSTGGGGPHGGGPSSSSVDHASSVADEHRADWMSRSNVIGVGVGAAADNPEEAVIVVYIDSTGGAEPNLPDQARGVRIQRVLTEPFVAFPACGSCAGGSCASDSH